MRRTAILAFTERGYHTALQLAEGWRKLHPSWHFTTEVKASGMEDSIRLSATDWTGERFRDTDTIVFVGACGIAVRCVAPWLVSKKTDPAVLVTDEGGRFVISLLSGHLGGANEMAKEAAVLLQAVPVITTATDLRGVFAPDSFAAGLGCALRDSEAAKQMSAALLDGKKAGFYTDYPWEDGWSGEPDDSGRVGYLPDGLVLCDSHGKTAAGETLSIGCAVTIREDCRPFAHTVKVIPRIVTLGMGCRKGAAYEQVRETAEQCLQGVCWEAVEQLASIDLKKEEEALVRLSREWKIPFVTFTAKELEALPGDYTASAFVRQTTGTDNICERSAMAGCFAAGNAAAGSGTGKTIPAGSGAGLIRRKLSSSGVTAAAAVRKWEIRYPARL